MNIEAETGVIQLRNASESQQPLKMGDKKWIAP